MPELIREMSGSNVCVPSVFHNRFWGLQSAGLVLVGFASLFPPLFHLQEYVFLILMGASVLMSLGQKTALWIRTPVDLPLGCFLLWVLCTVPFAIDVSYSFVEWRKFFTHALVFYWALLVLRRSGREALPKYVLLAVAIGATVLASYALVDFVAAGGTWRDRLIRARAIGSDYNWLSTYMVTAIPVLGAMLVVSYARWARGAQILALVLTVLAQIFSYTRAGWVAHIVQGVVLAVVMARRRLALAVLGVGTIAGLVLALASFAGFQKDTVDTTTIETRLTVWRIGVGEILAHPVVGIGYGYNSFVKKYPEYAPQAQSHLPARAQVIPAMHSAFLMVALGSGLPALICFVWIFVALLGTLFSRPSVPGDSKAWSLMAVGIGIALIGFSVRNLFDYMFTGSLAHLFWLLAAIGVMIKTSNRDHNISVA